MAIATTSKCRKVRPGVAATELALWLPLLCFLFVIAVDYARIFYFTVAVANCARNGAVYGCQDPPKANDGDGIAIQARKDAANLVSSNLTISSSTDSPTSPTQVTVTASYPFASITNFPGVPTSTTIIRTVKMSVVPLVP